MTKRLALPAFALAAALILSGCVDETGDDGNMTAQESPDYSSLDADYRMEMTEYRFMLTTLRSVEVGDTIWFFNAGDEVHRPVQLEGAWDVGDIEPGTGTLFEVPAIGDTNQSFKCEYHGDEPHNMRVVMYVE